MVFDKACYWISVGVLALFVTNNVAARHQGQVRGLVSQSLGAVEQVSDQATHFMAVAEMMLGRGEDRYVRTHAMLDSAQTRTVSVQTAIASHKAAFARVRAEHGRMVAMEQLRGTVVCPWQNLRIGLPSMHTDGTI